MISGLRGFLFTISLCADNTHFFPLVHAPHADRYRDEKTDEKTDHMSKSRMEKTTDHDLYAAATLTPSSPAGSKGNFIQANGKSQTLFKDTMMSRLLLRERKKKFEGEKNAHVPPVDHHNLVQDESPKSEDEEPFQSSEESLRALLEDGDKETETPPLHDDDNDNDNDNADDDDDVVPNGDPVRSVGSEVVYGPESEAQSRPSASLPAPPMRMAPDAPVGRERVARSTGQYPAGAYDEYPQRANPGFLTTGLYSSNRDMGSQPGLYNSYSNSYSNSQQDDTRASSSIVGDSTLCIHLWTIGGSRRNDPRPSNRSIARSFGLYGNTEEKPFEYNAYHGVGEYLKKSRLLYENGYWILGPRLTYVTRPGGGNGEEIVDTTCRSPYYDLIELGDMPHNWSCDPAIRYDMLNHAQHTEQFLSRQVPCDTGNQFDFMAQGGEHVLGSAHVDVKQQLLQHPAFKLYVHLAIGDTKLLIRDPQKDTFLKLTGGRSVYDADSGAIIVNKDVTAGEQIDEIIFELSKLHNRGMWDTCDRRLAQNTLLIHEYGVCSAIAECDSHITYLRTIVDRKELGIEVPQSARATYAWFENADAEMVTYKPGHMTRMHTEDGRLSYEGKRIRQSSDHGGRIPDKLMRLIQRFLTTPHDKNGAFPVTLMTPNLYAYVQYTKLGPQEILDLLKRVFRADEFAEVKKHLQEDGGFANWVRAEFPRVKILEKTAAYNQIILTLSQLVGVGKSCETTQKLKGLEISPELRDHAEQMQKNNGGPIMPQYSKNPCGISSTPLSSSYQYPAPGPNSPCVVGTRPWTIGSTCCSCTHLGVTICHECDESLGSSQESPYPTETQVLPAPPIPWSASPPPLGHQPRSHPEDIKQQVMFPTSRPPIVPVPTVQNYPQYSAPRYPARPTWEERPTVAPTTDDWQAYDLPRSPQPGSQYIRSPYSQPQYPIPKANKVVERRPPSWTPTPVGIPFTEHETAARNHWQAEHDFLIQSEEQTRGRGSGRRALLVGPNYGASIPGVGQWSPPLVDDYSHRSNYFFQNATLMNEEKAENFEDFILLNTLLPIVPRAVFYPCISSSTSSDPSNPTLGARRKKNNQKGGLKNKLKNGLANGAKGLAQELTDFGLHLTKESLNHHARNNKGQLHSVLAKAGGKAIGNILHRRNALRGNENKKPKGKRHRSRAYSTADPAPTVPTVPTNSGSFQRSTVPSSIPPEHNERGQVVPSYYDNPVQNERGQVVPSYYDDPVQNERGQVVPSYYDNPAQERGRGPEEEYYPPLPTYPEDYEDSTPSYRRPSLHAGTPRSREADRGRSGVVEPSFSMPAPPQLDYGRQYRRPYAAGEEDDGMESMVDQNIDTSPPTPTPSAPTERGIGGYNARDPSSLSYDWGGQSDFRGPGISPGARTQFFPDHEDTSRDTPRSGFTEPSGRTGDDERGRVDRGFGENGRGRLSPVSSPFQPSPSGLADPVPYDARSGSASYGRSAYDQHGMELDEVRNRNPAHGRDGGGVYTHSSSTFDYNNYNDPNQNNNRLSVYQQMNGGHESRAERMRARIQNGPPEIQNTRSIEEENNRRRRERLQEEREEQERMQAEREQDRQNTRSIEEINEENNRRQRERLQEEREEQERMRAEREQERRTDPSFLDEELYDVVEDGHPSGSRDVRTSGGRSFNGGGRDSSFQQDDGRSGDYADPAVPSRQFDRQTTRRDNVYSPRDAPHSSSENSSPYNPPYAPSGNYAPSAPPMNGENSSPYNPPYAPSAPPMNGATLGASNTRGSLNYAKARHGDYIGMYNFIENHDGCHWVGGYQPRNRRSFSSSWDQGYNRKYDCSRSQQCVGDAFVPVLQDYSNCDKRGGYAVHCCRFDRLALLPMYQD